MQPPEPAQPGTSLELTFKPNDENPERAASSAELELPSSAVPASEPELPTPADAAGSGAPGPLGDLVAAHFRRVEIAMLGRVLISTLGGALPASMIRLEQRRSMGRRLLRRAGESIGITITAGDRTLTFRAPHVGVAEASAGHAVRGVVLSSTPMPVAQWLDELAALLDQVARDDEATRTALERAFRSG